MALEGAGTLIELRSLGGGGGMVGRIRGGFMEEGDSRW